MFSENEVRGLEISLHAFEDEHTRHQKSISKVIEKYGQLLADFKSLQSDYEETKEARERYKKLAKGQVCERRKDQPCAWYHQQPTCDISHV